MSNETTDNKAHIKAWLYEQLAELERAPDAEGRLTEGNGRKVTIEIQYKFEEREP